MANDLRIQVKLHRAAYPITQFAQQAYAVVEILPTESFGARSQAVNFCLALDRSGSMAGKKLSALKQAAAATIRQLGPQDVLTVVVFDETAEVVIDSQPVNDVDALLARIEAIQERGGTKLSAGMLAGLSELRKGAASNRANKLVLLTDGRTWEDQTVCEEAARQAQADGVSLAVAGLGIGAQGDWDAQFLEHLAQLAGGEWYIVDTPEKVAEFFNSVLRQSQTAAVTNAQLTLRLASEVHPKSVWRITPLISLLGQQAVGERDVQIFLGEIPSAGQTLLLELLFPPRKEGTFRLMQAEVAYDVPAQGLVSQKVRVDGLAAYSPDAALTEQLDQQVMNLVERVTAHKLQTQALDEAAAGKLAAATQKLRSAATRLLELGEEDLAKAALSEALKLEQGGELDAEAAQMMRYQTKRLSDGAVDIGPAPEHPDK